MFYFVLSCFRNYLHDKASNKSLKTAYDVLFPIMRTKVNLIKNMIDILSLNIIADKLLWLCNLIYSMLYGKQHHLSFE